MPRTRKTRAAKAPTPADSSSASNDADPRAAEVSDEARESERDERNDHEGAGEGSDGGDSDDPADAPESGAELDVDADADDPEHVADDGDDEKRAPRLGKLATSAGGTSSSLERVDPLGVYLREVQRHPLLTPEETNALAVRFVEHGDNAAAARLVTSNLRLVVKIAYEYRRAYRNIMDLVQEGNIGLMQAVKRYDPYRGVKLSSYAAWWIRAYILRFILNNWRLVKLGTTQAQRKLFFNLRKKRAELQAMGIDPTDAEIAKQLNVPESDVAEMEVRLAASEKSLDAPVGDADGRSIAKIDMMPTTSAGPETLMADGELQALLKDKFAQFRKTLVGKEKDLAIFDERLVADDPLTLQELGDRFGISRERVRQLEQRLTGRLRDFMREEMGDVAEVL